MIVPSWAQIVCLLTSQHNPSCWPGRFPTDRALLFPTLSCSACPTGPFNSQDFTWFLSLSLFSSKCPAKPISFRVSGLINMSTAPKHYSSMQTSSIRTYDVSMICTGLGEWKSISSSYFGCRFAFLRITVQTQGKDHCCVLSILLMTTGCHQ